MVPHFITALSGPLQELEQRILASEPAIERWFRQQWMAQTPPIYSSVDVRNAGFKVAPVDTNLYPGGWNNLSAGMVSLAIQAAKAAVDRQAPRARRLLLVPENHTRNPFYLMNVARLQAIFGEAGLQVRIGSLNREIEQPTSLPLPDGGQVLLEPVVRHRDRLGLPGFDPDIVLVNNDLSAGVPGLLEDLDGQHLLPALHAGWHRRRKSHHFRAYESVAKRFGQGLGIDPWLLNPLSRHCGDVTFAEGTGLESLQDQVSTVLAQVRRHYKAYGIEDAPFVVVKADNGTYGMGIMTVRDASELNSLNRRTKNKMNVIKDGQLVSDVIVQEGVPTRERIGGAVAEPVVYMMDRCVVGGFYRAHAQRGVDENLNAPGAQFVPLAPEGDLQRPNRFYLYGVVGRLAALAASHELEAMEECLSMDACA